MAFFVLFLTAPIFDLLRYDLYAGHAWILTFEWHLGFDAAPGQGPAAIRPLAILTGLFLPIIGVALTFLLVAWRWGRLYCGWLCPHFSVVETLNGLMQRATGKQSLWDRQSAPWQADGSRITPNPYQWALVIPLAIGFAFVWALVLLTYLVPPRHVYGSLFQGNLSLHETLFIAVATLLFSLEFLFARHLFCRYACAIGIFQSIPWLANPKAMVVGFDHRRASQCANCLPQQYSACDTVCPMRLKPRTLKRNMFTCTQCGQCIEACQISQGHQPQGPLLKWITGQEAKETKARFSATGLNHQASPGEKSWKN
ncbi:4Fe-4S binding protein [Azospira inquinata]|nr:4Fe-4S binding protein [Azospira inquinata]